MKYFFSIVLSIAILFPTLVGAISVDKTFIISNILGSGGRFYNVTVPDFAVTVSSWSEKYELPANFLIPGEYVLVDTNDPDRCSTLTLDECRSSPYFVEEIPFSVKQESAIPNFPKETATTATATTTITNEAGIIPSIINGVLDFFGINTSTTTAVVTETSPINAPTTTAATAATSSTSTTDSTATISTSTTDSTATSSNETTPLPQGEIISPSVATTTQVSLRSSFLAAVGLLSLGTDNIFVAFATAIGILLLLVFMLYRTSKITKKKKN